MPLNRQRNLAELNGQTVTFLSLTNACSCSDWLNVGMRLAAEAGEPIIVLKYNQSSVIKNTPMILAIIHFGWIQITNSRTK